MRRDGKPTAVAIRPDIRVAASSGNSVGGLEVGSRMDNGDVADLADLHIRDIHELQWRGGSDPSEKFLLIDDRTIRARALKVLGKDGLKQIGIRADDALNV